MASTLHGECLFTGACVLCVCASVCAGLSVALSLGELPSATYQRLFDAGAHRYLLRIETSSPELYARLHPPSHSFQQRLHCLQELQRIGFQVLLSLWDLRRSSCHVVGQPGPSFLSTQEEGCTRVDHLLMSRWARVLWWGCPTSASSTWCRTCSSSETSSRT